MTFQQGATFSWAGPRLRFGLGASAGVGSDLQALGATRVLVVTDQQIEKTGLPEQICAHIRRTGLGATVWAGAETEPRQRSIERAMSELAGTRFDGCVGVGGGSAIDTTKMINLLSSNGGSIVDYVSAPHGGARPIERALLPMIGVPTTAGTGSECTAVAVVDLDGSHVKAAVTDPAMRPQLAVIDPLNTLTCPPEVTASAGYDALVQALESLTCRRYTVRASAPTNYAGYNPISRLWCEESIRLAAANLRRAVTDGSDVEARANMSLAALFSRLGAAGAHLPHANAYGVAGEVRDYIPAGFNATRPFVPHGQSVIVTAPGAFAFTYDGSPARHRRAAALLGVAAEAVDAAPRDAIPTWLRDLLADTDGPRSLYDVGLGEAEIPAMVERALGQRRLLASAPLPVTADDLTAVFREALGGPHPARLRTNVRL